MKTRNSIQKMISHLRKALNKMFDTEAIHGMNSSKNYREYHNDLKKYIGECWRKVPRLLMFLGVHETWSRKTIFRTRNANASTNILLFHSLSQK